MSRLDELPPDQRAALSLLLRQRRSYAQVAAMLGIADGAVRDRAQAALAMLAPLHARELKSERREEIGDFLLGQQDGLTERLKTRSYLATNEAARAWALAVSAELAPIAEGALPNIPPPARPGDPGHAGREPPAAGDAPAGTAGASAQSSRVGGALLLALILAAVVVAVVLLTGGGSSRHASSTVATKTSSSHGPAVTARLVLRSPSRVSRSIGVVDILSEGSKRAFYIAAEHLAPSRGFFYALWLYNSPSSHEPLSRAPSVGTSRRLEGGALLPSNASEFHAMLLTRETDTRPTHPGKVVLRGPFTLGG